MKKAPYIVYKWLGFLFGLIVAAIGFGIGLYDNNPIQYVMFYAAATFAIVLWGWHHFSIRWVYSSDGVALDGRLTNDASGPTALLEADTDETGGSFLNRILLRFRLIIVAILLLIALFLILAFSIDGFLTGRNILATLVFVGFLMLAAIMNRVVTENKSGFIGVTVLVGLFIVGSLVVPGFFSGINIKSMLVFAAFLGLACIGKTLVVMLGGLDLSIPFVIGSANVFLMYLFSLEVAPWFAVLLVLVLGILIGIFNGVLSFRLQGQALIITLGVGFAVAGGTQILTSIGTRYSGNVFGTVPGWLTNIAAMNGRTFGMDFPPVIVIWLGLAIVLIVAMRNTVYGRNLYALGGSRTAAKRLSISEQRYWVGVYGISGFSAALTGVLLLGWSGGGFIGVGDPYLFMTLAAVVIGGTSLLGGWGGYGFTVIGVLVLQVLTSFLVGIGLTFEGQQFVFGLLILPMVALYARSPHIRTQI